MLSPDIIAYLQNFKNNNAPFAQVEYDLRQQGIPEDQISAARQWYQKNTPSVAPVSHPSPQPQPQTQANPFDDATQDYGKKRSVVPIIITIVLLLILLGIGGAVGGVLAIAYDRIQIEDKQIKHQIEDVVMSFSFMPKTPRYILRKSTEAHEGVTKTGIDISFAATVDSLTDVIGTNTLDLAIKGSTDFTDIQKPLIDLNVLLTKELDFDIRVNEREGFFRINVVPAFISEEFQLDGDVLEELLKQWVKFDIDTIDTEARREIFEYEAEETEEDKKMRERLERYLEEDVLPKMTMSEDSIDGSPAYKFTIPMTQEELEEFIRVAAGESKLDTKVDTSQDQEMDLFSVNDFRIEVWIDKETYYARKTMIAMKGTSHVNDPDLSPPPLFGDVEVPSLQDERFTLVVISKMDNINQDVVVEVPEDAITVEEYGEKIETVIQSVYLSEQIPEQVSYEGLETLSTLQNATVSYYADNQAYPLSADTLLESPDYVPEETQESLRQDLEEGKILYLLSGDEESVFIYSTEADITNPERPYRGVIVYQGQSSTLENFSQEDIQVLEEGFSALRS